MSDCGRNFINFIGQFTENKAQKGFQAERYQLCRIQIGELKRTTK